MKLLKNSSFQKASQFIINKGRNLEKQIYNHYFNHICQESILTELKKYQNEDGGFGKGLESDFRIPQSSAIATTIAFQQLIKLDRNEKVEELIKSGVKYFEDNFAEEINGWFAVPKEVNDFPHAPWWHYNKDETEIKNWGNPSAEIIGYLYKYKNLTKKLDVEDLLKFAFESLHQMEEFEVHEIYCYVRLYQLLPEKKANLIKEKLTSAVRKVVSSKREDWTNYVPYPLNFINSPDCYRFNLGYDIIKENLDYFVDLIETNGKISPSWEWNSYEDDWKKAEQEWTGVLTLKTLIIIDKFNRLKR